MEAVDFQESLSTIKNNTLTSLREKLNFQTELNTLCRKISTLNFRDAIKMILEGLLNLTETKRGILLVKESDNSFSIKLVMGIDQKELHEEVSLSRTLVNKTMRGGHHKLLWDGRNENGISVASGLYFVHLKAEGKHSVKKMMIIK